MNNEWIMENKLIHNEVSLQSIVLYDSNIVESNKYDVILRFSVQRIYSGFKIIESMIFFT